MGSVLFLTNFIETGNWHRLFGLYVLSAKFLSEKPFGNIYGMPHRGQELYSKIQKEISKEYEEEKRKLIGVIFKVNFIVKENFKEKHQHQKKKNLNVVRL